MSIEESIIITLKELDELVGINAPSRFLVAQVAGDAHITGDGHFAEEFSSAIDNLESAGFIEVPEEDRTTILLTEAGAAQVQLAAAPATSNEQFQEERIKKLLKGRTAHLLFDQLVDGRSHVREQVAATVGYSNIFSKGFQVAVKQMRSLRLIEHPNNDRKLLRLTEIAFPLGRP